MADTVSGQLLPRTRLYHTRDIFKDGASPELESRMLLQDLAEAIRPKKCEECGQEQEQLKGVIECHLRELKEALTGRRDPEPVLKLFLLLNNSLDELHPDWSDGLLNCPTLAWAGQTMSLLRARYMMEAWSVLNWALGWED